MTSDRCQRGFSLIEAMVALLIIAVGLLGIAGLQGLGLNSTSTSRVRALAAIEASNMAAYLGSNSSFWHNLPPGGYSVTATPAPPAVALSDATLNGLNVDCTQTTCTPQELAAYDLKQWAGSSQLGLLPGGVGAVICGVQGTCTITVGWNQKQMAGSTTSTALAPSVTYFRMVVQP